MAPRKLFPTLWWRRPRAVSALWMSPIHCITHLLSIWDLSSFTCVSIVFFNSENAQKSIHTKTFNRRKTKEGVEERPVRFHDKCERLWRSCCAAAAQVRSENGIYCAPAKIICFWFSLITSLNFMTTTDAPHSSTRTWPWKRGGVTRGVRFIVKLNWPLKLLRVCLLETVKEAF